MCSDEYDVDRIIDDALNIKKSIDMLSEQLDAIKIVLISLGYDLAEIGLEHRDGESVEVEIGGIQ